MIRADVLLASPMAFMVLLPEAFMNSLAPHSGLVSIQRLSQCFAPRSRSLVWFSCLILSLALITPSTRRVSSGRFSPGAALFGNMFRDERFLLGTVPAREALSAKETIYSCGWAPSYSYGQILWRQRLFEYVGIWITLWRRLWKQISERQPAA